MNLRYLIRYFLYFFSVFNLADISMAHDILGPNTLPNNIANHIKNFINTLQKDKNPLIDDVDSFFSDNWITTPDKKTVVNLTVEEAIIYRYNDDLKKYERFNKYLNYSYAIF